MLNIKHHAGNLVMTLAGHENDVSSIVYSPDGEILASGSKDGTVRIWEMRTGEQPMLPLRSDDGSIWSILFSLDGSNIVSGTESGVVCLWMLLAGQAHVRRLVGHAAAVLSLAYSPDGSLLASASGDTTLQLWDIEAGELSEVIRGHSAAVNSAAFSPDGRTLASGSDDGSIRLWHSATGKIKCQPFRVEFGNICCICFSPDGKMIAAGSLRGLGLWESATGKEVMTLRRCAVPVQSVRFLADGCSIVSISSEEVRIWTLGQNATKTSSMTLSDYTDTVRTATISPDGLYIASAGDNRSISIWNAVKDEAPQIDESIDIESTVLVEDERNCLWTGHLSAAGASEIQSSVTPLLDGVYVASASVDGTVRIWNAGSSKPAVLPLTGHEEAVTSVAVSSAQGIMVSGSIDCTVRVWDIYTGSAKMPPLTGHTSAVLTVAISPDGQLIASGSRDETVRLWDARTGVAASEPWELEDSVCAVSFSTDGRWLAAGSGNKIHIWEVEERKPSTLGVLVSRRGVNTVAFSPNSKLIVAGCNGGTYLWDTETGNQVHKHLQGGRAVNSLAFSPDEIHVVSGGDAAHALVWDISTGQPVFFLNGHKGSIQSVAYSSDGRIIGTGSEDHTVNLWDAATGAVVATLYQHTQPVFAITFMSLMQLGSSQQAAPANQARPGDSSGSSSADSSPNPPDRLASVLPIDNWQVGSFGELLMWVPAAYRQYLEPSNTYRPYQRSIRISVDKSGWHRGEEWTSCWIDSGLHAPPRTM